jgi:hypothetical protein
LRNGDLRLSNLGSRWLPIGPRRLFASSNASAKGGLLGLKVVCQQGCDGKSYAERKAED